MKNAVKVLLYFGALGIVVVAAIILLTPWMDHWGATHEEIAANYAGDASILGESLPSAMSAAGVECTDCHAASTGHVARPVAATCVGCHDNAFADTLTAWTANGVSLLRRAENNLRLLKPGSDTYEQYRQLVARLRDDGSRTAHNPGLFARLKSSLQTSP